MKKLLVALLMLGSANIFAMDIDAGWTHEGLLGDRPVTQTTGTESTPANPRSIDTDWNKQGLGINQPAELNRPYNAPSVQPTSSVDSGWNIQDLR